MVAGALCDITNGFTTPAFQNAAFQRALVVKSAGSGSQVSDFYDDSSYRLFLLPHSERIVLTSPRAGARVCFTLGNKRVILRLNLACSNLYGGREAVEVKFAQLFFISLHFFFHLSPAFRSLGKLLFFFFFLALPRMTPGPLGFYWTAALIQAIKVVVTFGFFLLSSQRAEHSACSAASPLFYFYFKNKERWERWRNQDSSPLRPVALSQCGGSRQLGARYAKGQRP